MKSLKDMQLRGRENLIEMKPLTVKVEETGLEMRRPMRVRRMSTVKQMESILRLVHSWRWDELNKYQQDLIEMGNRGYRYFECVHPVSSEQPQTLGPLFDSIRKVDQIHRSCNSQTVKGSLFLLVRVFQGSKCHGSVSAYLCLRMLVFSNCSTIKVNFLFVVRGISKMH